jgi:hypothetical protein
MLTVVLEIDILACKFVFMSVELLDKICGGVNYIDISFFLIAHRHQNVLDAD